MKIRVFIILFIIAIYKNIAFYKNI